MKKVIALFLALASVLSLCACSSNKGHSSNPMPANNSSAASNSSSVKNGTVNLNDYITMDTMYHEKYGLVEFHYDVEALIRDNCDEKGVEKINNALNERYYTVEEAAYSLSYKIDKKIGVSLKTCTR